MTLTARLFTIFMLAAPSLAMAADPFYCELYKDNMDAQAYLVPDGQKPYGALKREIDKLSQQVSREQRKDTPDADLIADLEEAISDKEAILATKINYQAEIKEIKVAIKGLEADKREVHAEALRLYSEESQAAADSYCSGFTPSPYSCTLEDNISSDITAKKSELNDKKQAYFVERKWVSRGIAVKEAQNVFSEDKMHQNSLTLFGVPIDKSSVGLNKDGDGIRGDLTTNTAQLYSCHESKLTPSLIRPGNIPSMPMFMTKSDLATNVDVYFCIRQFLGEGPCLPASQILEEDSGWEGVTISKQSGSVWTPMHGDHVKFKSECQNVGTESESCRMDIQIVAMSDVDKDNLSLKSQNLLSINPSFQKVVDNALNPDYTQAFNEQKAELHFAEGCFARTIDETSGTEVGDTALISCRGAARGEDGKLIKTLDEDNNVVYSREDVDVTVNLLDCPIVEKCVLEKEEEIEYTEGCVSPFPVDEVMQSTTVPEGNCSLKFDKSAYTCDADRVMDTRTCIVSRSQSIEECQAKMTTIYTPTPMPSIIDDADGKQIFRMQLNSEVDGYIDFDRTNTKSHSVTKQVQNSKSGEGYVTVSQIFREEDMGKYVVFRLTSYHAGGRHSEEGLDGSRHRTWGSKLCPGPEHGDSRHCNKVNWFVINLNDTSGGKIETPTWTPPSDIGNVHEYAINNAQPIDFGIYNHARNKKRDYGGSPDEKNYAASLAVTPSAIGDPWCTAPLEHKVFGSGPDWRLLTPYAECSFRFSHSTSDEKVCPAGSTEIATGEDGNPLACLADGDSEPKFTSVPVDVNLISCDDVDNGKCYVEECDDEMGCSNRYVSDYHNFCTFNSRIEYDLSTYTNALGSLTTGMPTYELPSSQCTSFNDATVERQECLDGQAAHEAEKEEYDTCMAEATTPEEESACGSDPGPVPECKYSDFGWDKPYSVQTLGRGYIELDNATQVKFYDESQLVDSVPPPGVVFNEYSSMLAPHIEVTKTVGSDTLECQAMNELR